MAQKQKRRPFRHTGFVLDCINIIICLVILVMAMLLVGNMERFQILFPMIFLAVSIQNFVLGVKFLLRGNSTRTGVLFAIGFVMCGITILSMLTL